MKKSAQFHFLLPPLPLTPVLPSLILTTSSCHPQPSPQFALSPPNALQRRIYDKCGASAKAALRGPVQQTHSQQFIQHEEGWLSFILCGK